MRCALMWIARFARMRALMNLRNFVALERLLQNGLLGWSQLLKLPHLFCIVEFWSLIVVLMLSRAMSGSVPFEEALAARLSLFNPSLSQVQDYLEKRPAR